MSLTLNPYLMLLVFVVFMLLIISLNSWLYRPVLDFMARRNAMLSGDADQLEDEKQKIDALYEEARLLLDRARKEARSIKEEASQESQEKYKESLERARSEMEGRFLKSKKDLEKQRLLIRDALNQNLALFQEEVKRKISNQGTK